MLQNQISYLNSTFSSMCFAWNNLRKNIDYLFVKSHFYRITLNNWTHFQKSLQINWCGFDESQMHFIVLKVILWMFCLYFFCCCSILKLKLVFLHYVILTRTLGEAHYMQMFPFDEIWSTLIRGYFAMEIIVIGMWDRFQFYLQQQQQQKTAPLSPHTNGLNQRW